MTKKNTNTITKTFREHIQSAIEDTCDICEIVDISDN